MRSRRRGLLLILIVSALLTVAGIAGLAQQGKQAGKHRKPSAAARRAQAIKDSIAAARADSLRNALAAAAAAAEQRTRDSLAAAERADSLRQLQLRVVDNEAFGLGERLVFDVNYGWITAGEAIMSIPAEDTISGRVCYRVQFAVNSTSAFSVFFRVEDRYLTYIDEQAIVPWKFEQHVREGGYHRDFIAEFDQRLHVARTTEGIHPIPPYVHDILSAFYYTRTLDFSRSQVGDLIELRNFYKDTTHDLGVRFLGRQELEVAAGTFNTVVVEPLVKEGGLFKSEGRIVIWLSDDERKIPVRVNTKVIIGSIDTELREYAGLRGPLQARIR